MAVDPRYSFESLNSIFSNRFGDALHLIDPDTRQQMDGVYLFQIQFPDQAHFWTLDVRSVRMYAGKPQNGDKPDVTYMMNASHFVQMLDGKLNLASAYLSKKIRLQGNVQSAFKLVNYFSLIDPNIDLNKNTKVVFDKPQNPQIPLSTSSSLSLDQRKLTLDAISDGALKSDVIFHFISDRLSSVSDALLKQGPFVVQFNILRNKTPTTIWTIDTKRPSAVVYRFAAEESPDACLTVEDDAYVRLVFGQLNPQRAFMTGQIKVKGNILLLRRVDTLWNQIQKSRNDPELPFVRDLLLNSSLVEGLRSETVFFELIPRILQTPDLLPPEQSVTLNITKGGTIRAKWFLASDSNGQIHDIRHCLDENRHAQLELSVDDDDITFLIRCQTTMQALPSDFHPIQFLSGDRNLLPRIENLLQQNLRAKL